MFFLVCTGYELVLSSTKMYRSAISHPLPSGPWERIPPVFKARLDRKIQSGSIGAGLAARYDFSKQL
jgi:hypothetical protein